MLWDLNEGKYLYTLNGGEVISTLVFSPNRYWLSAATGQPVKIWVSRLYMYKIILPVAHSLTLSLSPSLYTVVFFITGP